MVGGVYALSQKVGNYGIPYQTLIALMSYLPLNPMHGYKICSIICDFGIAVVIYKIVTDVLDNKKLGLVAYIISVIHPVILLNSSVWGQCDAIFSLFCVISLMCFLNEKHTLAFIFLGIGFSFKLQSIFLIPFVFIEYICKTKNRFSLFNIIWIPICMVVLSLGGILQGRSISDLFQLYVDQAGTYQRISNNYPSIWNLLVNNFTFDHYQIVAPVCITFSLIALGLLLLTTTNKGFEFNKKNLLFLAFFSTYMTVFFLPSMHERYSYIYIIIGLILTFVDKNTIPAYVGLVLIDCHTYSKYLFNVTPIPWMVLVCINIICMCLYCYRFRCVIQRTKKGL